VRTANQDSSAGIGSGDGTRSRERSSAHFMSFTGVPEMPPYLWMQASFSRVLHV
jgi:hypothetical protein